MVILHIACITNDLCKGVCVAVPQHINAQKEVEDVGFINVNNIKIQNIANQYEYKKNDLLFDLPFPYNSPDIVVFHEVYRFQYIYIYKELLRKKIPYIIVPHGCLTYEAQKNKKLKKRIANLIFFNKFIYSAKALHCLSEREKKNIKFKTSKFVSGNGTTTPLLIKEKFNEAGVSFVYIGRIDIRIKGLDILLEAIYEKKDFLRDSNAKFYIAGSVLGDDTDKLKELIENKKLSDIVFIQSAVKGNEKETLLLKSDIFILTSRTEGMPMGVIEALNYGIPCLVTQGTSVMEMIVNNNVGWGCETTVDALAETIKLSILERNRWIEKSDNARTLMEEQFRWDIIASNTIQKYSDYLNN